MNDATTTPTTDTAAGIGHNQPPEPTLDLSTATLNGILARRSDTLATRQAALLAGLDRFKAAIQPDGIPNDETLGRAGDFDRQLRELEQALDAQRTEVKAPVLAASKIIDGHYRSLSDPLGAGRRVVQDAMSAYAARKRREAEEQARAEAAALARKAELAADRGDTATAVALDEQAEQVAQAATAPVRVASDLGTTVFTRKGPWKVRITDAAKIPREYLMPNEPKLLAEARTNKAIEAGEQPIPGVEFYRETKVGTR